MQCAFGHWICQTVSRAVKVMQSWWSLQNGHFWYGHYRSFLSSRLWTLVILTCFSFVQCMWNTDKIWCTKASVLCFGNTSKWKTRQRETLSTPQNFLRANCFYHQLWNICICVSGFSRVNWIVAIKIKRNSYYHFGS